MKIHKAILVTLIFTLLLPFASIADDTTTETIPNDLPDLNGTYAISMDVETKEIIFSKGIDEITFPASTTKIMTALIFAENKNKTDLLTYTENALSQPSYSLNTDYGPISLGYEMTGDMVMKSLLIYSANDVAAMVQDSLASDNIDLIAEINSRIKLLGLKNSHFVSPNGIHDENHYTSAYDLSMMAIEAFSNPWIQEVLSMEEVIIEIEAGLLPVTNSNQKLNNNGLIYSKTGYTEEAGRCLVAIYERDGRKIVAAIMHAEYSYEDLIVFEDMDKLMNWSFDQAKTISYLETADFDMTTEVTYLPLKTFGKEETQSIPLTYKGDLLYYPNDVNNKEIRSNFELYDIDPDKLSLDEPVGKITLTYRNVTQTLDLYPTINTEGLYAQHEDLYKMVKTGIVVGSVVGILLILLIGLLIKKKFRKQRRYF